MAGSTSGMLPRRAKVKHRVKTGLAGLLRELKKGAVKVRRLRRHSMKPSPELERYLEASDAMRALSYS
jgi:hypothetical protein